MKIKASIAIAVLAVLSAFSASAEWRGNEPCSGKEGIIGSCLNRAATRSNESSNLGKAECTSDSSISEASLSAAPKVAAKVR